MPTGTPSGQISQIIAAQDHWYVNFTSPDVSEHNNHLVIGWAVMDDNTTVLPLITSPSNQRDVITANSISDEYAILNPYSQCPACVRPSEVSL
jgi:hypothetical protein